VIECTGVYSIAGVVGPPSGGQDSIFGYPIIGDDRDLPELLKTAPHALVAVGQISTPQPRIRLFAHARALGAVFPVIVSPEAYVSKRATVGAGSIVMHGAIVNAGARIGENCIINSQALVEHDVEIGSNVHVSTGARLNGGIVVGDGSFIGSGSVVHEGVVVGSHCIIGAGTVLSRNVSPNRTLRRQG
jgi:sugar O-acyltransferase (sialic acid O-acetyltransferase NeuD family)